MKVTAPVRHVKPIQVDDFKFLQSITRRTPKVTIPSPTMLHFRGGREAISREAYPDLELFFADVAAAYALGVNSYIVKPVEFEKFIDVAAQIDLYWCVLNQQAI